jgi:hypothetical protein
VTVIVQKEAAEREQEGDALAAPRRRRGGPKKTCARCASYLAPECSLRVEVAPPRALIRLPRLRITLVSSGNLPLAHVPAGMARKRFGE